MINNNEKVQNMQCQHEGCSINIPYLICEITGKEQTIYRCPNHLLIDLKEVVETLQSSKPLAKKCECCDNTQSYKINYGRDGDIHLCLDDLIAFIQLDLEPERFKKLYAKYPEHYMLHDDFYIATNGLALQPVKIL